MATSRGAAPGIRPALGYSLPIHTGGHALNWDAIGATSEGLSAVAVFVTLAYLAIQIRQTTHDIEYQYECGMLSDDEWEGFRTNLKDILRWPLVGEYWSNESHYYSKRFRTLVTALQREIENDPSVKHAYVLEQGVADD